MLAVGGAFVAETDGGGPTTEGGAFMCAPYADGSGPVGAANVEWAKDGNWSAPVISPPGPCADNGFIMEGVEVPAAPE